VHGDGVATASVPRREIREFTFKDWKSRPIPTLQGTGILTEELEESIMQMQTFLTMRHVAPFREEATELLANLNDAADTLEQWVKVQLMWCSLESVFTGMVPVWKSTFGRPTPSPRCCCVCSMAWSSTSSTRRHRRGGRSRGSRRWRGGPAASRVIASRSLGAAAL